ncbi:MAG: hypothetical protein GY723_19845 [bacterium]|nr:hypothetical protein [bacterium]MCP5067830.1 hypothetical protein [bacterium]
MNRIHSLAATLLLAALSAPAAAQPMQQGMPGMPCVPCVPVPEVPEQEPEPTISELRIFLEQIGRVLITRQNPLTPIALQGGGSVQVSGVGAFEPGLESQRLLGLRIDLDAPDLEPEERIAYLDLHEIEELLRGMAGLGMVVAEQGRGLETEAHIITLEGFGVGVRIDQGVIRYQVRGGEAGRILGHLSPEGFANLEDQIETARDRLFNAAPER